MTYQDAVLASAPVGYWPLDERIGPVAQDISGYQGHGEYRNGPALGGPGPFGDACAPAFSGVLQYVEIASPLAATYSQPTSGAGLSIECWMRPDVLVLESGVDYLHWLAKGDEGAQEWAFRFYSSSDRDRPNRISCYCFNPVPRDAADLGAGAYFQSELAEGAWIYVVGTLDPGDASDSAAGVTIFRDGVRMEGPTQSPGARYENPRWEIFPAATASPLRIATRNRQTFFTGAIAQVAIYPRVLSADEVSAHYDAAVAEGLA
jgi:hypothetical protein